jgi:hypothetical protein
LVRDHVPDNRQDQRSGHTAERPRYDPCGHKQWVRAHKNVPIVNPK